MGHLWEEVHFRELLKRFDRMWDNFDQEVRFFVIRGEDGSNVKEFW